MGEEAVDEGGVRKVGHGGILCVVQFMSIVPVADPD